MAVDLKTKEEVLYESGLTYKLSEKSKEVLWDCMSSYRGRECPVCSKGLLSVLHAAITTLDLDGEGPKKVLLFRMECSSCSSQFIDDLPDNWAGFGILPIEESLTPKQVAVELLKEREHNG